MMMMTTTTNCSHVSEPSLCTLDTLLYFIFSIIYVTHTIIILILQMRNSTLERLSSQLMVTWLARGRASPGRAQPLLYNWGWAASCLGQDLPASLGLLPALLPSFLGPSPESPRWGAEPYLNAFKWVETPKLPPSHFPYLLCALPGLPEEDLSGRKASSATEPYGQAPQDFSITTYPPLCSPLLRPHSGA